MRCRVQHVQFDRAQRVLAIGGVRGRLPLLEALLRELRFAPGRDGLVVLGDLAGRGRMALETVHFAIELARLPYVHFLCGEEDLLPPPTAQGQALAAWQARLAAQRNGLFWQLCAREGLERAEALAQPAAALAALRPRYAAELAFLEGLPHIVESSQYLFAHAGLGPGPLEEQSAETVLTAPAFHDAALRGPAFAKLLTVGHWPAGWYGHTTLCQAPRTSPANRLVSVDGGLGIAVGGQLNGAVLRGGVCEGFAMVDGLPQVRVRQGQAQRRGAVCLTGPDYGVRVLRQDAGGRLCLHPASGSQAVVPEGWLRETPEGGWRLRGDTPSWYPALIPGQTVGLAAGAGELALIKTGSHLGWARWDSLEMPKG